MARKGQQQIEALHQAARTGDLQQMRWRLDRGVSVDAVVEAGGRTALCWAAREGEDEAVRLLLERGANVNDQSALTEAAMAGQVKTVRLLLERGANVNQQNGTDWTALMCAVCRGHLEIVTTLLEYGADAALKSWDDRTALSLALDNQDREPDSETPEERVQRQERHALLIQRLTAAQPDGPAAVEQWNEERKAGERWWARSFRRLYHDLETYQGTQLFQEVLAPFLPHVLDAVQELQQYRRLNTAENSYELQPGDLWQLYALNRVNDFLLLGFQTGEGLNREPPFPSEAYRNHVCQVGCSRLAGWQGPGITLEEYESFFAALGFRSFGKLDYSAFFH